MFRDQKKPSLFLTKEVAAFSISRTERNQQKRGETYVTILASEDRSKELRQRRPSVRRQLKQEPRSAEKPEKKAPARKKQEPER